MNLDYLPIIMFRSLLCTIVIECIISLIIGIREKKDILNIILVNIMTNPIVVSFPIYIMIKMHTLSARYYALFFLEIFALLSEGIVYSKVLNYKSINPFQISLILNMGSYLIGDVINRLL